MLGNQVPLVPATDSVRSRAAVMGALLPSCVEVVEVFGDITDEPLFTEEKAVVAKAVDKRRREFTTARACARAALARLGLPPTPILPDRRGAPGWPPGVVGSLTHCDGYRAAAVASSHNLVSVGIDAEPHEPLPEEVLAVIALPQEQARLTRLAEQEPQVCWGRLLFSAKESIYKAWYPMTGRWLDFEEADVTFQAGGCFHGHLLIVGPVVGAGQLTHFTGRWRVVDSLIVTAVVVGTD